MASLPNTSELLNPTTILAHARINAGQQVADLCCGSSGHFVFPMSQLVGKEGVAYAVDILKSALNSIDGRAKIESISNVVTVWSDVEKYGATKIEPESLDVVSFINDQPKLSMIKEGVRLLKAGGILLIVDWNAGMAPFGPPPEKRNAPAVYKEAVPLLGLTLKEQFVAGPYHYGLIFEKVV